MKNIFLLFPLILFLSVTHAQNLNYSWHQQLHGLNDDNCRKIIITPDSGVVAAGYFSDPVDFNPDAMSYMLSGSRGKNFLAKYSFDGHLIWAFNFDTIGHLSIVSLETDFAGDVFISGTFLESVDMDPTEDTLTLSNSGHPSIYIAKYSGFDGHIIQAVQFGNAMLMQPKDISIDHNKNLFLSGTFADTIDLNPGSGTFNLIPTPVGTTNCFIAKYDSLGNFIHAVQLSANLSIAPITCDATNKLYIAGYFGFLSDFDPGPAVYNMNGRGAFILKLENNLNFSKVVGLLGNNATIQVGSMDLICNQNNELLFTGELDGRIDFDGSADSAFSETIYPYVGTYFTRQDTSLNYLSAFTHSTYNYSHSQGFRVNNTSTDKYNNMYALGEIEGLFDADPGSGVVSYQTFASNTLLVKYGVNGNYLSSFIFESDGEHESGDVGIGKNNEILLSFDFKDILDLKSGPDSLLLPYTNTSSLPSDAVIVGILQCQPVINTINPTICSGESFRIGTESFNTPGTFTRRLTSTANCDSIIILNLQVKNIDFNICVSGEDIFSSCDSATFKWLDCDNNQFISGATASTFHVNDNKGYAVEITRSGCVDTSDCFQIFERGNNMDPEFSWGRELNTNHFGRDYRQIRLDSKNNLIVGYTLDDTSNVDLLNHNWYLNAYPGHLSMGLAKYDHSKNLIWSFMVGHVDGIFGNSDEVKITDLALDDSDNIYVIGLSNVTFDIDPGISQFLIQKNLFGSFIGFLVKYNSSGQFLWAKTLTTISAKTVFTDHKGSVYVAGSGGSVSDPELAIEEYEAFSGNLLWSFYAPGSSGFSDNNILSGAADNQNNIMVTGLLNGNIDFDPDSIVTQNLFSSNNSQFIAQYNSNHALTGLSLINQQISLNNKCKVLAGCEDNFYITNNNSAGATIYRGIGQYYCFLANAVVWDMSLDQNNNLYAVFNFEDSCIIGTDTFYTSNNRQMGVAKFDEVGKNNWSFVLQGTGTSKDIEVNDDESIYVSGMYDYYIDLNPDTPTYSFTSTNPLNAFLAIYNQTCAPIDTAIDGDSLRIQAHNLRSYYQWIDCSTGLALPGGTGAVIPHYASGYFKVVIYQGNCVDTSDCHFASPTTGITENESIKVDVYPNPAFRRELTIASDEVIENLQLFSPEGTLVFSRQTGDKELRLNFGNVASGIYLLHIMSNEKTVIRRVVFF